MPLPQLKIRRDNKKQAPYPIYLQVWINKKRFRRPTGVLVSEKDWDPAKEKVKRSHPRYDDLNMVLMQYLTQANEVLISFRLRKIPLTYTRFEQAFDNPQGSEDFLSYWEEKMYEQYQRKLIKPKTLVHHKRHLKNLRSFLEEKKKVEKLFFFEINPRIMAQFDLWLAKEMEKKKKDGRGERWNCQKAVKRYLTLARQDKKQFEDPFPPGTKIRSAPSHPTYLTESELQRIYQLMSCEEKMTTRTMRIVLRSFLVQCFSGMRFSEVRIAEMDHRGPQRLVIPPFKTETQGGTTREVPLNAPLRKLLKGQEVNEDRKWCMRKYKLEYTPLCPTISEPKTNKYLKLIARMAHVNKKLTTHVGRHTFATIFLEKGGSLEVLKELLGHRSLRSTMVYVHITNQRKHDQVLDAFDGFGT